ncbi:mitochondrial carnitine/acylcarnitine carrier protein-like isoform X2 [Dysidea avara]|uniref:mitochondrial carnitine/acylcarnitine carrier protein-like isoform X2 n=1 Tax=Dysidea avara TaxID=196820 RepID=UPI0033318676
MGEGKVKYKEPSFLKSFISGGVGGVAILLVGHPMDTVKTRLQTMPKPLPGQPPLYRGTFHCLYSTLQKEGVRGAYRGLLSPLIGVTPVYCLYFLGYSTGKKMQLKNNDDILNMRQYFIAGMVAGLYSTVVYAPVERVKCVMQIQQGAKGAVKYSSSWDCAWQLYRQGGIRNIFRGTMATALRDIPAGGIYFSSYEWLLQLMTPEGKCHHDLNPLKVMFAGGVAGVLYWIMIPVDILKTRLQIDTRGRTLCIRQGTYTSGH